MKVRVLKSSGETGFRSAGTVYELSGMLAKAFIKAGLVEDAAAPADKPKPKPKPKRKPAAKKKA
jgi:hypothetical protein